MPDRTLLGALSLLASIVAAFYTTASDAMVSPKLMFGSWEHRVLQGRVRTSYANPLFVQANCPTPLRQMDPQLVRRRLSGRAVLGQLVQEPPGLHGHLERHQHQWHLAAGHLGRPAARHRVALRQHHHDGVVGRHRQQRHRGRLRDTRPHHQQRHHGHAAPGRVRCRHRPRQRHPAAGRPRRRGRVQCPRQRGVAGRQRPVREPVADRGRPAGVRHVARTAAAQRVPPVGRPYPTTGTSKCRASSSTGPLWTTSSAGGPSTAGCHPPFQ